VATIVMLILKYTKWALNVEGTL